MGRESSHEGEIADGGGGRESSGHPFPGLSPDSVTLLSKNLNDYLEMLPRLSGFHEHAKTLPVAQTMRHETISRSDGDQTGSHCDKLTRKRPETNRFRGFMCCVVAVPDCTTSH
jgi:hypothetical protein